MGKHGLFINLVRLGPAIGMFSAAVSQVDNEHPELRGTQGAKKKTLFWDMSLVK